MRNNQRRQRLNTRRLKHRAQLLLGALARGGEVLSILLTDDREMERLHERWMGDPTPTDVLSFSSEDRRAPSRSMLDRSPPRVLGDIAISVETAARKSPAGVEAETERYLIHGLLHLAGYDHARKADRERMDRKARWLRGALKGRRGGG